MMRRQHSLVREVILVVVGIFAATYCSDVRFVNSFQRAPPSAQTFRSYNGKSITKSETVHLFRKSRRCRNSSASRSSLRLTMSPDLLMEFATSTLSSNNNNAADMVPSLLLSSVTFDDLKELSKSIFIVLLFGGGLIPAAIAANTSMVGTIMGTRRGGDNDSDEDDGQPSATSLDPYKRKGIPKSPYVFDSDASGPALPLSGLLFAKESIPLVDVIAIVGRLPNLNAVADWNNLPSTTLPNVNRENPPMWLPRSTFKQNVRRASFAGWPVDSKGQPIGGQDLQQQEESRIRQKDAKIGDAALDAVFDTWAWGASVATPDKVQTQLRGWRPNGETFLLPRFVASAIGGRSVTGLGIITFIVIQTIAYGTLFVAPFLRVFFDFDIGFGELGSCSSANGCTTFSDLLSG